ncbi:unnamed protein product, partial [Discosporangium mesarthrocarpum]
AGGSISWQKKLFALNPVGDAVCTTCQVLVPRGTTNKSRANMSNLVAHYRNYHSEKLAEAYQARESKMKQRGGKAKQATLDIVVNKSREERLKEGIADFVIVDQQPLSVVEEQTFMR